MIYTQPKTKIKYSYTLKTEPTEAMYWETYKLLKSHIKLTTKETAETKKEIIQEIYDDILSREPNTRAKRTTDDKVQKERKAAKPTHAKTRKTKRKTW